MLNNLFIFNNKCKDLLKNRITTVFIKAHLIRIVFTGSQSAIARISLGLALA